MEGDTILVQDLFVHDPATGRPVRTGLRPSFVGALQARGIEYPPLPEGDPTRRVPGARLGVVT